MPYDPSIHRRRSIRLKGWDYTTPGAYFVTTVVQGRTCLLDPPPVRAMVRAVWESLPERFPAVRLDEFVIMPNHVHFIVWITEGDARGGGGIPPVGADLVSTPFADESAPSGVSLGRIVQTFKSITTVEYIRGVKRHGWAPFLGRLWQRNYYEHIIRNRQELQIIRRYICDNPARWTEDREFMG